MKHYYFLAPAAAADRHEIDGHRYVYANVEMYQRPDGQRHVREVALDDARLLLVNQCRNGVAYALVGKAGDAIACTTNLPHSVVVTPEPL